MLLLKGVLIQIISDCHRSVSKVPPILLLEKYLYDSFYYIDLCSTIKKDSLPHMYFFRMDNVFVSNYNSTNLPSF